MTLKCVSLGDIKNSQKVVKQAFELKSMLIDTVFVYKQFIQTLLFSFCFFSVNEGTIQLIEYRR